LLTWVQKSPVTLWEGSRSALEPLIAQNRRLCRREERFLQVCCNDLIGDISEECRSKLAASSQGATDPRNLHHTSNFFSQRNRRPLPLSKKGNSLFGKGSNALEACQQGYSGIGGVRMAPQMFYIAQVYNFMKRKTWPSRPAAETRDRLLRSERLCLTDND
jgi:hypothetical protein